MENKDLIYGGKSEIERRERLHSIEREREED